MSSNFIPKVVQVLYTGYNKYRRPTQQAIKSTVKNARQTAREINSIFTEGTKGLKSGVAAVAAGLGLTQAANANTNTTREATIRPVSTYDKFRGDVQSFFRTLGQSNEQGAQARQDAIMELITAFIPIGKAASVSKSIAAKATSIFEKQGAKAAADYVVNTATNLRNQAVKAATKIAESPAGKKIREGVSVVKGTIDDAINNASKVKNSTDATKAEKYMADMLQKNAGNVKRIADEVGVTSAKEIPSLLKFINQTGDILKNAPVNIARKAQGLPLFGIGATGLSIYDLYQAFKEGGDNLLPRVAGDVGMAAASFIPGGTIAKILYSTLGYAAGNSLARASLQKLGVIPKPSSEMQQEYDNDMAFPGLQAQLAEEYPVGQSGRKYHVVGDRIYSFDTGKPVKVSQALQDISSGYEFKTQQLNNRISNIEQQKNDIISAQQSGYNVDPQFYNQLNAEQQAAINELNNLPRTPIIQEYDPSGDLVAQYQQINGITPPQGSQSVVPATPVQQRPQIPQVNFTQVYQQAFERIAQNTYNDIDKYINPKGLAVDYYQYQIQAVNNQVPYMTIDQYVDWRKMQVMQQVAPVIQQQALSVADNYQKLLSSQQTAELEWYKARETERRNRSDELIRLYNLQETMRSNRAGEGRQMFEAQTGRLNAITGQQNAATNRMTEQRQQQILPYQQAEAMSTAAMNMSMSGMSPDQLLNANPKVMSQVFPGTAGQSGQQPQQQSRQGMFNQQLLNKIQEFRQIVIPQYRINNNVQ